MAAKFLFDHTTSEQVNTVAAHTISLGAIGAAFAHVLPVVAAIPPALYYCMLVWEKMTDIKDKTDRTHTVVTAVAEAQRTVESRLETVEKAVDK